MTHGIHAHAHHGTVSPLISLGLILLAFFYFHGWLRIRSASPVLFPKWRLVAFMGGLFLLWIALGSPLASLDHQLLTAHMLKHLLVMTVSAPLISLGEPSWPLLCGLPKWWIGRSLLLPRRTPLLFRYILRNSVFAWLAGTMTVVAWHVPSLFQLGFSSPALHTLQDLSFLGAGLLFWQPFIRNWSSDAEHLQWSMPLYLFLATLPCDILSAFLTFCGRVVYPSYLSATQFSSVSPLGDQEFAGAMMWVWITFAYLFPAVVITMRILAPDRSCREVAHGTLSRPVAKELSSSRTEVT